MLEITHRFLKGPYRALPEIVPQRKRGEGEHQNAHEFPHDYPFCPLPDEDLVGEFS